MLSSRAAYVFQHTVVALVRSLRETAPALKPELRKHYRHVDPRCAKAARRFAKAVADAWPAAAEQPDPFAHPALRKAELLRGVSVAQALAASSEPDLVKSHALLLVLLARFHREAAAAETAAASAAPAIPTADDEDAYSDEDERGALERLQATFEPALRAAQAICDGGRDEDAEAALLDEDVLRILELLRGLGRPSVRLNAGAPSPPFGAGLNLDDDTFLGRTLRRVAAEHPALFQAGGGGGAGGFGGGFGGDIARDVAAAAGSIFAAVSEELGSGRVSRDDLMREAMAFVPEAVKLFREAAGGRAPS